MATKSWRMPLALALISWGAIVVPAYVVTHVDRGEANTALLRQRIETACACSTTAADPAGAQRCLSRLEPAVAAIVRRDCRPVGIVTMCTEPDGKCTVLPAPVPRQP